MKTAPWSTSAAGSKWGFVKCAALTVVSLALVGIPEVRATTPKLQDPGDLEHYHHEFYSHSYLDPNYREDQDHLPSEGLSKSKVSPKPISSKTKAEATVAFGGHRRHR